MPSSKRKGNISGVWRRVKRFICFPLSIAERNGLQRHGDEEHTNDRSSRGTGCASGLRTRINQRRYDNENSDTKEICKLKERSAVQEKKIERLEGKVAEQSQLVQETLVKLTSVERSANQKAAQETQVIGRLEEKVAKLDRDLQEKTAALYGMVGRKDARNMNCIKEPEANVPESSQDSQDKIAKVSGKQNSPTKLFSSEDAAGKRDKKIRDLSATYRKPRHTAESKQTNKPLPQVPVDSADGISVAEVADLVKALNADLEQTSCRIQYSLSCRRSPLSGRELEVAFNELRDYLGLWMRQDLQRGSRKPDTVSDPMLTQIVLQTGLVNACSQIINGLTAPNIGRGVVKTWRAQARSYTSAKSNNQEINENYLTRILCQLIYVVGGLLQSDDQLPHLYQEEVKSIVSKAVALQRIINEEVIPLELVTYTIQCGTEFDSSCMEDMEEIGGSTPRERVICTTEMGLQYVEPGKSRQELTVAMKAKVVLPGALDVQDS